MGAWPADDITTTHVDAASDDPSQARAQIYTAMVRVKDMIGARGSASGVAPLDASSLVPLANIPSTLTGKSADLLDGINSSQFARLDAASNFTTAPTISSNTVWHAGNDGAGSGLDADLLDGYGAGNGSGQVPISNGTVCTNLNADLLDGAQGSQYARLDAASNFTTAPTISSNVVWHAGNDGAGSGLDADMMDGMQSSTSNATSTIAARTGGGDLYANGLRANASENGTLFSGLNLTSGSYYDFLVIARNNNSPGNLWSTAEAVAYFEKYYVTGRSINASGTINASGADYAEYERKCDGCGEIAKGDIVGFDADGRLTDRWADAISFGVKSTDPSYVGGDTWSREESIGMREPAPVTVDTVARELEAEGIVPAWADYDAVLQARLAERQRQYLAAREPFDAALEAARARVDRIAYAGKVPVNVTVAQPGDYIVPVEAAGGGITGRAVPAGAVSFEEYRLAVGQVRRILPDGRAEIAVKVL